VTLRPGRLPGATVVRRRLCPAPSDRDAGNAIVEFVYLAVLLMIPLVYVLLTVFRVQSAAFAVSSAAREAGRVYATSDSVDDADPRAFAAAGIVMADSGLSLSAGDLRVTCSSSRCLQPGSRVEVAMSYQVALPLVPHFLSARAPALIRVTSHHLEVVDRYREPAR
jgi:Flp pilus assembly protein TadG